MLSVFTTLAFQNMYSNGTAGYPTTQTLGLINFGACCLYLQGFFYSNVYKVKLKTMKVLWGKT